MVGDFEGLIAGLEALTVAPIPFNYFTVDPRTIFERVRHATLVLHALHELIGDAEVLQTARGTDDCAGGALGTGWRDGLVAARRT